VNARLDAERSRKLEFLARSLGKTVTEVLRDSIDQSYETALRAGHRRPWEIFERSGYIGSAEGPPDLSSKVKKYVARYLDVKSGRKATGKTAGATGANARAIGGKRGHR
jgi:hypothetical protein